MICVSYDLNGEVGTIRSRHHSTRGAGGPLRDLYCRAGYDRAGRVCYRAENSRSN